MIRFFCVWFTLRLSAIYLHARTRVLCEETRLLWFAPLGQILHFRENLSSFHLVAHVQSWEFGRLIKLHLKVLIPCLRNLLLERVLWKAKGGRPWPEWFPGQVALNPGLVSEWRIFLGTFIHWHAEVRGPLVVFWWKPCDFSMDTCTLSSHAWMLNCSQSSQRNLAVAGWKDFRDHRIKSSEHWQALSERLTYIFPFQRSPRWSVRFSIEVRSAVSIHQTHSYVSSFVLSLGKIRNVHVHKMGTLESENPLNTLDGQLKLMCQATVRKARMFWMAASVRGSIPGIALNRKRKDCAAAHRGKLSLVHIAPAPDLREKGKEIILKGVTVVSCSTCISLVGWQGWVVLQISVFYKQGQNQCFLCRTKEAEKPRMKFRSQVKREVICENNRFGSVDAVCKWQIDVAVYPMTSKWTLVLWRQWLYIQLIRIRSVSLRRRKSTSWAGELSLSTTILVTRFVDFGCIACQSRVSEMRVQLGKVARRPNPQIHFPNLFPADYYSAITPVYGDRCQKKNECHDL